jgi:hypothetical protein
VRVRFGKLAAAGLVTFGGAVLGACSSSPAASTGASGGSTTTSSLVIRSQLPGVRVLPNGRQYVLVGGKQVILPTEINDLPVGPSISTGQQVLLTPGGPWPRTLLASSRTPIVFTNLTVTPERVTFEHDNVRSTVIAPAGGTWSWKAQGLISIVYRDSQGTTGNLTVDALP